MFTAELNELESNEAVESFQKFLTFATVSGTGSEGSYDAAFLYLQEECANAGLDCFKLEESLPGKPILVATWTGQQPDLPCLVLNSHYDVVPVIEESWTVPAFEGMRRDGRVYGRGAQDMKCVCIQYIAAIKKMKGLGYIPLRTIHLTFVPDEEVGGQDGMVVMLESDWFQKQQVALALDEGLASEDDAYSVFYGERLPWWIRVRAQGNTGHGSRFIAGTAVSQIAKIINNALEFRELQRTLLHGSSGDHSGCSHSIVGKKGAGGKMGLGDVTTLNITKLEAGLMSGGRPVLNVIPQVAEAYFDIRISPHTPPADIAATLDKWCKSASDQFEKECEEATATATAAAAAAAGIGKKGSTLSCNWEFVNPGAQQHATTSTDSSENVWWRVFEDTMTNLGVSLKPEVFPAATDSRFLRAMGIKAFGFSPMRRSPILLHEHDEYLAEDVFIEGCNVYVALLQSLASQGKTSEEG